MHCFYILQELRFIEAKTRKFGLFAVVLKLKRDTLTFTKKGNKVFSTVDPRVTFNQIRVVRDEGYIRHVSYVMKVIPDTCRT
jgi:hypothetical protein